MDETNYPTVMEMGSADDGDGGHNDVMRYEDLINTNTGTTGSDSNDASDLDIDSTMSSSMYYGTYTTSHSYTSPRALILASKSSEEEMVVPQSMVKARHKWIEETLLKDGNVTDAPVVSKINIQRALKTRHSMPANATSTSSGLGEDVLARVQMTTEARRLSREAAKAKVQADIAAILSDDEPTEDEAKDRQTLTKSTGGKDFEEVADLRARAQMKLNSAMELLASTSPRNASDMNSQRNSLINIDTANSDEIPMQNEGNDNGSTDDGGEEPVQQNDSISVAVQSEQELLSVEDEAQGEIEHQNEDHVEVGIVSSTDQHDDDEELDDVALEQINAEMLHEIESVTDLTAIEKQTNPKEEMAKLEEEVRQSVQKRLVENRIAEEAGKQAEHRIDDGSINAITQASFGYDLEVNNSSNSSGLSDSLLEKPSENSDGSLPSQVDEILFQGKESNTYHSENEYDDGDIENGYYGSVSQSSDIDPSTDMDFPPKVHSPGPMWKRATEQASMMATETRLDALDPSFTRPFDQNARQMDYHPWQEVDKTTEQNSEFFTQWNGFNRERMIFMVVVGVLAGLLPSLYAQWTCHFVTGENIDDDELTFILNFGLQEFTPIDSSVQGYTYYCLEYDSKYNYKAPTVPQVAGIVAIVLGTIALMVIGVYLLVSITHRILWNASMWMLYVGSICQISTLSIFLLDICQDGIACSMGPGAWATVVSALSWFVLSLEMKANSALAQPVKSDGVVVIERQSALPSWVKKVWNSAIGEPSLSRTAMMRQKRVRKGASEPGRYKPPVVI